MSRKYVRPRRKAVRVPSPKARKKDRRDAFKPLEPLEPRLLLSWVPPGTTLTDSGLPLLHSDPDAPVSIYLDFQYESRDGERVLFNPSGDPQTIDTAEQEIIALAWAKTAAAYAPFNVDVTTEFPDATTPFIWAAIYRYPTGPGSGGGARTFKYMDLADYFVNRYDATTGRVQDGLLAQSWCREGSVYGDVIIHETGHSHGVNGHEAVDEEGNYIGIQNVPIERGPYTRSGGAIGGWFNWVTEWAYQSNPAGMYYVLDDMKVISSAVVEGIQKYLDPNYTGDGYRPDDFGNTIAEANPMSYDAASLTWYADGIIERWADTDVFSFDWSGGTTWVGVQTAVPFPLLDGRFTVTDAAGNIIAECDPAESYQAATRLDNLAAGTYYIHVASNGDYTDLGEYQATVSTTAPAALAPVTELTFDGNSLADSSGAGHDATTATGSALYTTGPDGSAAARFNGTNRLQVYQSGNFTEKGLSPWGRTISFWFKADGTGGTQRLLEDVTAPGYQIYIENGRLKAFAINDEGLSDWRGGITLDAGVNLVPGQWHHVALTHRTTFSEVDGTIALYLDGEEVARGGAAVVPNTDRFYIGSTSFSGAIDDVRIFSEVVPQFLIEEWAGRADLAQPAPTGAAFNASAVTTHDTVQLDWSNVGGATGYLVYRSDDNQHFDLVATITDGTRSFEDTGLGSSQQYFYRIAAEGADKVAVVEATTRAAPVRFLAYTKVKNVARPGDGRETAESGDTKWASKADIWGHNCEGIYGITLWFFGPEGWRDTGLQIEESTDGVNFTTVVTLPPNESVYYDNGPDHTGLVQGQVYTYRVTPVDDLGVVTDAAVILQTDPLNFLPETVDDTASISGANSATINVLTNDSDFDGDALSIASFTQGDHGTVTRVGNQLVYTRPSPFVTADTFTYTATDPFGAQSTATVTVTFPSVGAIGIFPGSEDIGSPSLSGAAGYALEQYAVVAGGNDIWNASDQFHFVHRTETGDVEMIARVDSFASLNDWGKAGIMFRDSTAANSAQAMVLVRPDNQVAFEWRLGSGDTSGYSGLKGGTDTAKYIRLVRSGDDFTAYYGTNGTTWTKIATKTIPMAGDIEAGLAVTSHDTGSLGTAQFSHVQFVPNAAPTANDDSFSVAHDTPRVINQAYELLANDTDADGDALKIDSFTQPTSGALTDNGDGTFTYTPNAGFVGNDSFTYTVSDNNGGYDVAIAALTVDLGADNTPPEVINPIDDFTIEGSPPTTLKVFLLIGQSNMEGQAYTYDSTYTAGWNIPTMEFLLSGTAQANTYWQNMPDTTFTFKNSFDSSWLQPRDDVWGVHYYAANGTVKNVMPTNDPASIVSGIQPLQPGFGVGTNFGSMIGPELGMGICLGNALDSPIFLFKSDQGGTTLGNDWRPPTAVEKRGGAVGLDYTNTMNAFISFLNTLDTDLADDGVLNAYNNATSYDVSGVFWLQGWNEQYNDGNYTAAQLQAEYKDNLKDLIYSIRAADPRIPDDLGIIIGESSDQDATLNAARIAAVNELNVEIPSTAAYFDTDNMIGTDWSGSYPAFSTGWGYHFNARAENVLEIGWRAGMAVLNTGLIKTDLLTSQIDLSNVFYDAEDPTLALSVSANSNTTLISTSIVDSTLTLTYTPGETGLGTITVRGTDSGGLSAEDSFTVTVIPPNQPPTVVTPITDVTVDEDAPDTVLNLATTFVDDVDPTVTLSISGNTNTDLVTASLNGTDLALDYVANANGTADVTVRATDSRGLFVEDTFTVTVNSVNDTPFVVGSIADVTVDEDAADTVIDLAGLFSDVEDASLTLTVADNTNDSVVSASINGTDLTLTYLPNAHGNAEITLRGTDTGGLYAETTFAVTVNAVPDAPIVLNPIGGLTVDNGYPDKLIDLTGVFMDPDGPTPTFSVTANTDPDAVVASVDGTRLTLSFSPDTPGTATITVRATDAGGLFAEDTFPVRVGAYLDPTGLVARYTFDDNAAADTAPAGTVDDSGTLTNGASVVTDPTRGQVLSLDGADDFVAVTPSDDFGNAAVSQRTVSLWFKANDISGYRMLYDEGGKTSVGGLNIYIKSGVLNVHIYGSGGVNRTLSKAIANDQQWHNVVMILNNSVNSFRGYVDLMGLGSSSAFVVPAHFDGIGIGRVNGSSSVGSLDLTSPSAFDGLIDDVRVYDRALADPEIASLFGLPLTVAPIADVTVDWLANDQVVDLSGVFYPAGFSPMVYTVTANTNPAAAGASVSGSDLTLDYTAFVSGTTTVTVRATADSGYYAEDTFNVTVNPVVDPTAPVITQTTPPGVAADAIVQPTDHVALSFDDAMYAADANDAANYQLVTPGPDNALGTADDMAVAVTPTYDAAAHQVTLTAAATLGMNHYRLTVFGQAGHGLRNEAGLLLDGDADGSAGGDRVLDFAVSATGDANLDGVVDAADYIAVKLHFGASGGWSVGDFDGSGTVNFGDLQLLVANMGGSLPPLADPPPTAVTAAAPAVATTDSTALATTATIAPSGTTDDALAEQAAAWATGPKLLARATVPAEAKPLVALHAAALPAPLARFDALGAATMPQAAPMIDATARLARRMRRGNTEGPLQDAPADLWSANPLDIPGLASPLDR